MKTVQFSLTHLHCGTLEAKKKEIPQSQGIYLRSDLFFKKKNLSIFSSLLAKYRQRHRPEKKR